MLSALWNRFLTIFRPDRATLEPYVDFDNQSGTLSIRLEGIINGKRFIFSRNAITKGKGTVGHRRFQFDSSEQTALLDVLSNCQWVNDSSLICPKTNVPSCLSKLRSNLRFKQSPSAEKVGIHPVPVEHRTYLELDDPETLIVRQNFVSQEGHTIQPPETVSEEWPDWLRVDDQFFKTPQETIRQHERGRRVAPGVQRLTRDEVPEFLAADLQAIRKGSRIFSEPGASELRVV